MHVRQLVSAFVFVGMAATASMASASPVHYSLNFDGSVNGSAPGTGSLDWDPVARTMTSLRWDFGNGRTGGMLDSTLAFFSNEFARSLARILGLEAPSFPDGSLTSGSGGLVPAFPTGNAVFCSGPTSDIDCLAPDNGSASYLFSDGAQDPVLYIGRVTAARSAVPEPGSLVLLGVGLLGTAARRFRRK